jgi:hypothetical protein
MARTANDSWDIATSVGVTAVMAALARAADFEFRDIGSNPVVLPRIWRRCIGPKLRPYLHSSAWSTG